MADWLGLTHPIRPHVYFDGPFEIEPEPDGADDADLELTLFLRLGDLPGLTVDGAEVGAEGELFVEFSEGTQVTLFGPSVNEPPYTSWQQQER